MITSSSDVKSMRVKRLSQAERRTSHQGRLPLVLLDTTVANCLVCSSGCQGYLSNSFEYWSFLWHGYQVWGLLIAFGWKNWVIRSILMKRLSSEIWWKGEVAPTHKSWNVGVLARWNAVRTTVQDVAVCETSTWLFGFCTHHLVLQIPQHVYTHTYKPVENCVLCCGRQRDGEGTRLIKVIADEPAIWPSFTPISNMTVAGQGRGSLTEIHGWVLSGPEKNPEIICKALVGWEGRDTTTVNAFSVERDHSF